MVRRRDAVDAYRPAARYGNLGIGLGGGQPPAMARFGALAELELDHLDLVAPGVFREFFRAERAVGVATTEITGADLPDKVATVFAVIGTVAALAGVMGEIAFLGADIERADGVRAERAKAHRRNVEDRRRIGL